MPRKSEPWNRRCSAGLAAAKIRPSTSIGGLPSSSKSTFSRAPVTKRGGPTGRQPCATTASTVIAPLITTPTAPRAQRGLAEEEQVAPRLRRRARHAADLRASGEALVERGDPGIEVRAPGIDQQQHVGVVGADQIGQALRVGVEGLQRGARQRGRDRREAGRILDLAPGAEHAAGRAAEEQRAVERAAQLLGDRVIGRLVMRRDEAAQQVGACVAEPRMERARDLAHGAVEVRRGGDGGGEPHRRRG